MYLEVNESDTEPIGKILNEPHKRKLMLRLTEHLLTTFPSLLTSMQASEMA